MDKSISTALFIVVSMVMALMLFNVAYPAIVESGDAISGMTNRADEQMRSQITVIHAAGELDQTGTWQDTNVNGEFEVFVWVKNVGDSTLIGIDRLDVFLGPEGNFARIPHQSHANGSKPYWTYQIENAAEWTPTATVKLVIHYQFPITSGRYFVKVVVPNGVADEDFFGL